MLIWMIMDKVKMIVKLVIKVNMGFDEMKSVTEIYSSFIYTIWWDELFERKLAKTIFVINHENHKKYFQEIVKYSKYEKQLINCKTLMESAW